MMGWRTVLEAILQWSSTAAGRNDGGDSFPLDGSESPLSLFYFTLRQMKCNTEISVMLEGDAKRNDSADDLPENHVLAA